MTSQLHSLDFKQVPIQFRGSIRPEYPNLFAFSLGSTQVVWIFCSLPLGHLAWIKNSRTTADDGNRKMEGDTSPEDNHRRTDLIRFR